MEPPNSELRRAGTHKALGRARQLFVGLAAVVLLLVVARLVGVSEPQGKGATARPMLTIAEPQLPGNPEVPEGGITDADLLSGLTASCENGASGSGFTSWSDGDAAEKMLETSRRLSTSPSSDHLLLASYWETDQTSRAALLDRAISISPADPHMLWAGVQFCSGPEPFNACAKKDWEQRLIAIDGSNSETWARVAANRFAAGENEGALEALKRASASSESRTYWIETIEMTERSLQAASDFGFPERASLAIGVAAANQPRYTDVSRMCRTQSARSVEWAHACLAYGQLAEHQVETDMGRSIARSIQSHAYEALGDLGSAETVKQRSQAVRGERFDSNSDQRTSDLMLSNPNLFHLYLAAIRADGELVARQRITSEVERLLRQHPEVICN